VLPVPTETICRHLGHCLPDAPTLEVRPHTESFDDRSWAIFIDKEHANQVVFPRRDDGAGM
jgi:hypothetical protein